MEQDKHTLIKNRRITKNKLREYRDAFSLFDKDGNGYLTKEELGHVMHKVAKKNFHHATSDCKFLFYRLAGSMGAN